MKLIDAISHKYSLSKKKSKKLLDQRLVFVNNKRVWIAGYEVSNTDAIDISQSNIIDNKINVLYEDSSFLVLNKSSHLLSVGRKSLEQFAKAKQGNSLRAVHRLDKDTSGVLLFAKSQQVFNAMVELFKKHHVKKEYLAIVAGHFPYHKIKVDTPIDGKTAISNFTSLKFNSSLSLLSVSIETGRTHQIRKHLKKLGFYLVGEKVYKQSVVRNSIFRQVDRHLLHAEKIEFPHPFTGEVVSVKAPLPKDFQTILYKFNLNFSHN